MNLVILSRNTDDFNVACAKMLVVHVFKFLHEIRG